MQRSTGSRATRLERDARPSVAAPALLIGGIVLIIGAFLDWTSGSAAAAGATTSGGTIDLSGYNLPDGRIAAGIGLALAIAAVLMWANKRMASWFDADLLGVTLAAIALGVIVTFLMDVGSGGRSADLGVYVALAGAVIALVGGIAALVRSGSDRATLDDEGRGNVDQRTAA